MEPCYEIHQDAFDYKGYVHIKIPKSEDWLYPFIDFIYEAWGLENLGIREDEQSTYITIRAGESELKSPLLFNLNYLIPFIEDGTIEIAEGLFIVRSAYRKTNLELPIKLLDTFKQLADKENITMSQWVEQAIRQAIITSKLPI